MNITAAFFEWNELHLFQLFFLYIRRHSGTIVGHSFCISRFSGMIITFALLFSK